MNEIQFFLIKLFLTSGVMYLGYKLILSRSLQFAANRLYLLSALVLPMLLPFVSITDLAGEAAVPVLVVEAGPLEVTGNAQSFQPVQSDGFSVSRILYFLVAGVLVCILIIRIISVFRLLFSGSSVRIRRLVLHFSRRSISPFSFFHHILMPRSRFSPGSLRPLLMHESVHVRQWHTLDVLICEIVCILQWFNPFVWLIRKAIRENHEYLADSGISRDSPRMAGYKALLFETATGYRIPVANNFNQSSLKKRFHMLNQNPNRKRVFQKTLATLALSALLALPALFLVRQHNLSAASLPETIPNHEDTTFKPAYPHIIIQASSANEALAEFGRLIKYPENARKAGKQGLVLVAFQVNTDSTISNVRIKEGFDKECDAEALRVVKSVRWVPATRNGVPATAEMVYPIRFRLDDQEKSRSPEEEVFQVVEDLPEFPGGEDARKEFLKNHLKYPDAARKAGLEGTVYITFIVEKDGSISNAKVLRGIGKECDEAALDAIRKMPSWTPGKQRGKPVRVQFNMPVRFKLDQSKKATVVEPAKEQEQEFFVMVEEMPEYPGGKEAMANYLATAVKYPAEAKKAGVKGTVYVSFIVEEDGKVTNVKILRGIGHGCDEIAAEAVKAMPAWKPGKQRGKNVRVQFNLPVKFELKNASQSKTP